MRCSLAGPRRGARRSSPPPFGPLQQVVLSPARKSSRYLWARRARLLAITKQGRGIDSRPTDVHVAARRVPPSVPPFEATPGFLRPLGASSLSSDEPGKGPSTNLRIRVRGFKSSWARHTKSLAAPGILPSGPSHSASGAHPGATFGATFRAGRSPRVAGPVRTATRHPGRALARRASPRRLAPAPARPGASAASPPACVRSGGPPRVGEVPMTMPSTTSAPCRRSRWHACVSR